MSNNINTELEKIQSSLTSNNDNVVNKLTNNDIDNDTNKEKQVDLIALKLVDTLNNPQARLFYCKIAWSLPESKIWSNLETAMRGNDPKRYFSWLCKRDMQ